MTIRTIRRANVVTIVDSLEAYVPTAHMAVERQLAKAICSVPSFESGGAYWHEAVDLVRVIYTTGDVPAGCTDVRGQEALDIVFSVAIETPQDAVVASLAARAINHRLAGIDEVKHTIHANCVPYFHGELVQTPQARDVFNETAIVRHTLESMPVGMEFNAKQFAAGCGFEVKYATICSTELLKLLDNDESMIKAFVVLDDIERTFMKVAAVA